MATLPIWPQFAHALGIDPSSPQAIVAGQYRQHHGPLAALQRCWATGKTAQGKKIWTPRGSLIPVDRLSDEGGIFWRPACPGGHIDDHFCGSHLVFYEIDDRPLAGQWEALDRLTQLTGLEPAAVVFSGSKSLHVYFKLDRALAAENWRRVMRKLAIAQQSDPQIVSLNRMMRLPGAKRFKGGQWVEQSIERLNPDATYSPADFEAALDGLGLWPHGLSDDRWRLWQRQRGKWGHQAPALVATDDELFPKREFAPIEPIEYDGQAIPLERCLSRRERDWLASGIPNGERNASGLVLGRSLVGTYDWLTRNGYRVDGNPESLFWGCLGRSGLGEREINTLWRQANRGNPRPSVPDEALEKCVAWVIKGDRPKRSKSVGFKPATQTKAVAPKDGAIELYHSAASAIARGAMPLPKGGAIDLYHSAASAIARGAMPLPGRSDTIARRFQQGDRLDLWDLATKGATILDSSAPGTGKTYDAARFPIWTKAAGKQFVYLANNHRNPDDPLLRNLPDLPSKHGGLVRETKDDRGNLTPHLRLPRPGEEPTEQGSCYHADSFTAAYESGLILGAGKDSPLCQHCPWAKAKWVQNEDGSESIAYLTCDYLDARAATLEAPAYRAHIDSVPMESIGPNTVLVIEEASQVLRTTKKHAISADQVNKTEYQLRSVNPELAGALAPLFIAIQRAIGEALTKAQGDRWHGTQHTDFVGMMPSAKELEALIPAAIVSDWAESVWPQVRSVNTYIKACLDRTISLEGDLSLLAYVGRLVDSALAPDLTALIDRTDAKGTAQRFKKHLRPRLLGGLLKSIAGCTKQVYRVEVSGDRDEGRITITSLDSSHRKKIARAGGVILLDGTADPRDMERAIGRPVVWVSQQLPCYRNLTIKLVTGLGVLGAQRRIEGDVTQMHRLKAVIQVIKAMARGDVGVLDYLKFGPEYESLGVLFGGHFTGDGRGSNRFANCSDVVQASKPVQNLGGLHDQYMAETGDRFPLKEAPGSFWAWVNRLSFAESKQEGDRLRPQHGDNPKTLWKLLPNLDTDADRKRLAQQIEHLKAAYPGASVEVMDVMDLTPSGGSKGRQMAHMVIATIIEKAKEVATTGAKVTQAAIAQAVGCTSTHVAGVVKAYAGKGFKDLVKTLVLLFSSNNNKSLVFELPSEVRDLADRLKQLAIDLLDGTIAPDDARETLAEAYIESGETVTAQAIEALPARERRALHAIVDRSSLVEWLEAQVAIYGRARVTGNRAIEHLDDRELAKIAVDRHW